MSKEKTYIVWCIDYYGNKLRTGDLLALFVSAENKEKALLKYIEDGDFDDFSGTLGIADLEATEVWSATVENKPKISFNKTKFNQEVK